MERPDQQDLEAMLDDAAEAADLEGYRLVTRALNGEAEALQRCGAIWRRAHPPDLAWSCKTRD